MAVPARLEAQTPGPPGEPGILVPTTILVGLLAISGAFLVFQRPAVVLVAVVAAVLVFLCAMRVDFALLLLVAAAPLEGAIQFGAESQLTVAKLTGALAFGSFCLFALATRRRLLLDRSHALVAALLGLALLSTLQARDIPQGFATTMRYAGFVVLYLLVSQFVGDHKLQRRIVWVLSVASTIAALLTIQNFISESTFQAALPHTDANDTAFVLAITLPLTFWLFQGGWTSRFAAVVMIGLISASIVLSFSRGALVGLAAAAVFHLITERRHALLLGLGLVAALIATLLFARANPTQVETGFEQKQRVAETNVESRLEVWSGALQLVEEKPLLGVGPGNFREHVFDVTDRPISTDNPLVVHNAYLDVAVELGVLAAILFIAYVAMALSRATVAKRARVGLPGYATAVRSALIVAAVASIFLSEQYFAPIWLLGGLATALWREGRAEPAAPGPTP